MVELPRTLDLEHQFPAVSPAEWRSIVDRDLRGAPFERKLVTRTYEGIGIQPLYTAEDRDDPGEAVGRFPFTRGGGPVAWDLRQERAEPLPESVNRAILSDLEQGVTSVLLRLDAAGRRGLDPDDPKAGVLVGTDGVSLPMLGAWDRAFEGVHLQMIGVALEAGAAFDAGAAMLAALWDRRGVSAEDARGAFNADPLAVLARDGSLPGSLDGALVRMGRLAAWTSARYPNVTSVRVGSAPYHHAGASAAQDIAFGVATGLEYLRALADAGLTATEANRQMVFSSAVGCHFFLAIAKQRAGRRVWARVLEKLGVRREDAVMRTHVRTSKRVLTTRDAWTNLLRNTASVFAAAVGGADAVTSAAFDQSDGLPSARGARLARHTATIVHDEAHLTRVADPAGGSWYIESLTDALCERAWPIVQRIEACGGMAAALLDGTAAGMLDESQADRSKRIRTRATALIGVSEFPNPTEERVEHPSFPHASVLGSARRAVVEHKRGTDPGVVAGETVGGLVEAATRGATIGTLFAAVTGGEPASLDRAIAPHPYAADFEALRDAVDAHEHAFGVRPRACLVRLGSLAETSARSGFATGLFEAGGIEVVATDPLEDVDGLAGAFAESGASIAVVCSTDARYEASLESLARALRGVGARSVVLAGHPGDREPAYRAAGVDRFVFLKCDALTTLRELLSEEGVAL